MWKAKVLISDYADMCHSQFTSLQSFPQTKRAACFTFLKLDLTMEVDQIRVEDGTFQKCTVNKELSLQTLLKCIYL